MNDFLPQNVQIFPSCILLTKRIDTLWFKSINKFWSGGISTVWTQKSHKKDQQHSQRFVESCELLIHVFFIPN